MKQIIKHIVPYLIGLLWTGVIGTPVPGRAQISTASVLVLNTPVIDSITYKCYGGIPIQVYVSNQIKPCVYSIVSTIPAQQGIAPLAINTTGTFYNVTGITDAVFRVHNGSCYTDQAIHFDCNGMPLPVILQDFSARLYKGSQALLNWEVTQERGIVRYEVEESADGRTFTYLGSVTASGSEHYEYTDESLLQGYNFYRLRIIDQDGSVQYSAVRFVIYSRDRAMVWYPNPTNHYLYLEFYNEDGAENLSVKVYNSIAGTQWVDQKYKLSKGLNKLAIDVSLLSDGSYFLMYGYEGSRQQAGSIKFQKVSQ
ncbi:hypothetical protein D3C72_407920 [compost metagenome]